METIPYRNTRLYVKTIPKGTLLFRYTKTPENDLRGIPRADGTRCIHEHHQVFFYATPFVGKLALGSFTDISFDQLVVYRLIRDIRVLWLLKPSTHTRASKNTKRSFLKRCSTVRKGCLDTKRPNGIHASYNPCFSETLLRNYPDIVGMIANQADDASRIRRNKHMLSKSQKSFLHSATDALNVQMPPELILYPLQTRKKDMIVHETDKLAINYEVLRTLSNERAIEQFMNEHTTYNPETFYFEYK